MGPFDKWPNGYGFEYFYGFIAGETSQYEPRLYENTNPVEPPHSETYHLTEDMADKAIGWMKKHRAFSPDKPFLMYWAPGAAHGPHHVASAWADKYKGKFNDGWDALREKTFKRQKELGWIPSNAELTPRDATMPSWDSIPESEHAFQTRLMEVFAGFAEHTDVQVGRVVDYLNQTGQRDNTIILYIWGDIPWLNAQTGLADWDSANDVWQFYDLTNDFSRARDLAAANPEKLAELQKVFLEEAEKNKVFPIGGSLLTRIDPTTVIASPYKSWAFDSTTTRMPEFIAPGLGKKNNTVTIDLDVGENASGVLYALGGASGGLTCYMDQGHLCFEYNMMIIERYWAKSAEKIAPGKHTIVVDTTLRAPRPGSPADIVLSVDGSEVARTVAKITVPGAFTASETFDVGTDLG